MDAKNQQYNPQQTAQFFNEFGSREWDRWDAGIEERVSLYLHRYYLNAFVPEDARVLEIGAGPGRFTQTLASKNARVVVGDISTEQLKLNRQNAQRLGFDRAVQEWVEVDITDLSHFSTGEFEVVVAYGGPFSYVLDQRDQALAECIRVLSPGGILILSVMSLWGSCHRFLSGVLQIDPSVNEKIIATGDITAELLPERGQFMHMFRAGELHTWLSNAGLAVLVLSASGVLVNRWGDVLSDIHRDSKQWTEILNMEVEASREPGARDMGTHLIAVARKTNSY